MFATKQKRQQGMGRLALALFLVTPVACFAQTPVPGTPAPAPAQTGEATNGQVVLAPDDILNIIVTNRAELTREVIILQDGTFDYPYAGEVQASGLTINQLKDKLTKALSKTFVRPKVNITIKSRQIRQANVIGAVKAPGKVALRENSRLLDIIAVVGLESDRYEFYRATLFQDKTKQTIPIDLQKLLVEKDPAANLPVSADDVITISVIDEAERQVQVLGQVVKPGPVLLPRSGSIVDVLQSAGGPTPSARLSQVKIERRDGTTTTLDMRNFGKVGFNPSERLQSGDRLIVPLNEQRITFTGAVGRPGEQPYPDDRKLTVFSSIGFAGGQTNGAELKKVRVTRTKQDGKTESFVVNVEKMYKTGDLSEDKPVEPGDTINVPASPGRRGLSGFEIISLIGAVPIVIGLITGRLFR